VTRWAHEAGLRRLELAHSTQDPASCRVAGKAGYVVEGTRRRALLHEDGWHDMHLHAHLGDDLR
jgi:ribosomal-protein-alanine N-acetyltransferase